MRKALFKQLESEPLNDGICTTQEGVSEEGLFAALRVTIPDVSPGVDPESCPMLDDGERRVRFQS